MRCAVSRIFPRSVMTSACASGPSPFAHVFSTAALTGLSGWGHGRPSGGSSLVWRREVGVPVHELPVAVDAPVDVGDPNHHVAHWAAFDADVSALEADCVGEVSAGGHDGMLHVHGIGSGEAASDPAH